MTDNTGRRAVLYARVSGDDRDKDGRNLKSQIEMAREYAREHGYIVIDELPEDDRGAKGAVFDLPQLSKVRDTARQGLFDVLIVREIDRFARSIAKQMIVEEELKRAGVRIEYVLGEYPDTPEGNLQKNVKASVAEYEREKIRERTTRGKKNKANNCKTAGNGKIVGDGIKPYGYAKQGEKKDAALVVNEQEAVIVKTIFTWYTRGDGDNKPMSAMAIARRLSETGIPAPGVARGHRRKRIASAWGYDTVLYILRNEVYTGVWYYRVNSDGKQERFAIPVPSIISRKVWEEAQARREFNRQLSHHNKAHQYLLIGMIRCSCGRAMGGNFAPGAEGEIIYYRCSERYARHKGLEVIACKQLQARADIVESVTWEYVLDLLTDPARFEDELRRAQAAELDAIQPKREQLAVVDGLVAEAEREAGKLARALVKAGAGVVADTLQRQIADVNGRHAKLTRERDRLQAEIAGGALTDIQIEQAMTYRRDVIEGLRHATFEDKRAMMELLQVEVTIKGHTATVRCRVPVGAEPREIDLESTTAFQVDSLRWIVLQSEPFNLAAELFGRAALVHMDMEMIA